MKRIFDYIDYRAFLRDFFDEKKKTTRHFSTRYLSQKTGIKSPNFFKRVIDGTRNLTPAACEKLTPSLGFRGSKEAIFFRHLVGFNQASTAEEKQEHYSVMVSLMHSIDQYRLTADQYSYYTKWYTSVIRELVCLGDFQDDFQAIARAITPPITPSEAKKSLRLLLRLKLLTKKPDGTYRQTQTAVRTNPHVQSLALREFYGQILDRARESIDTVERPERNLSGMTVGISRACFDIISTEIEAFKDRLATIVARDSQSDRVYQISLNIFPLSKRITMPAGGNREES